MKSKIFQIIIGLGSFLVLFGCTKLHEDLQSTLTQDQVNNSLGDYEISSLTQAMYNDLAIVFSDWSQVYSLEENSTDEMLCPVRGGDWSDGGIEYQLRTHTWTPDHVEVLQVFNSLNKINYEATNILKFQLTAQQAAEARCGRAFALYYLLDLYGKFSVRDPGSDLLTPPPVKSGAEAAQYIIDEINAVLPDLANDNVPNHFNQNVAKVLLMRAYLNRAAFINRASPIFADSDMQQVVTLGQSIINAGGYRYASEYFSNFAADNGNSPENIFTYVNTAGVTAGYGYIDLMYQETLHYNQYTPVNPGAGWNGYCTSKDIYNSFGTPARPVTAVTLLENGDSSGLYADTAVDTRIGGRYYPGVTDVSGQRPGFMIGQQYNETGHRVLDRKGNNLVFLPDFSPTLVETNPNTLELVGIRVLKYSPDFSNNGAYYFGPAGNDLVYYRYSDVTLMLAEAYLRQAAPNPDAALALVNELRTARKAAPLPQLSLVNPGNIYDPYTLICERGRELYWESARRTDLIRFGLYLNPWSAKPSDDPKNLVFPIPTQALAANPNLKQNQGY
jgi:starch-binding outer membrane protein, SusD/RagB family